MGEEVEDLIKGSIEGVEDVVVHMEPKDYCELKAEANRQNGKGGINE